MKTNTLDAKVRTLLVDDNEPFRQFVASMLRDRQNLNVIGEAGDGLEAVQRAEALQPDLILLDIGLPGLNGLDAARQISKLAPNARIIFLTQESASDVVERSAQTGCVGLRGQSSGREGIAGCRGDGHAGPAFCQQRLKRAEVTQQAIVPTLESQARVLCQPFS